MLIRGCNSLEISARLVPWALALALVGGCKGSIDDGDQAASGGDTSNVSGGGSSANPTGSGGVNTSGNSGRPGATSGGNQGVGGAGGGAMGGASTATDPGMFGACPSGEPEPGATPLMKLSTLQYRNTVRDLLAASGLSDMNAELAPLLSAVPDDSTVQFRGLDQRISSDHLMAYFKVATAIGDGATKSAARLTALAGACATQSTLAASCLDGFLNSFGRRALRRPLNSDELAEYRDIAQGSSPKATNPAEALRNVVVTLLMSPRFVNHLELDGSPMAGREDYIALDPFVVASRLSYTFWQTLPDEPLLTAAADGTLATDAGFRKQLDRVFADARTQQTVWQFWNEWLHFESFTGFVSDRPAFQSLAKGEQVGVAGHDHYRDMVQEVRDLTELYTWKQAGTFNDLMTSTVSVTKSADLAHLYGVPAWSGSGAYPTFTDGSRVGLLQRAALLASSLETTNPFHRGSLIRRAVLCDDLPRPDPNSLPPGSLDTPPPSSALTTRQRYEAKVSGNNLCKGCHSAFSNIGYVLEAYDALGRFRTSEKVFDEQTGALVATLPIDTNASIDLTGAGASVVSGPAELNQRILASGKVEACLSANYFRYALRRDPQGDSADSCAFENMRASLSKGNLSEVFRSVALEASFRRKKVGTP
ncbi:MAG TPA: DUF1592 domain-containing protein [Polyangiaceae bacterium]|nr:DUF1592 domain-containing protein [Polyangiaceae bacterium]